MARQDPARFRPADYREAAAIRLAEADRLHREGASGLALYLAGVATECILRAHLPAGTPFDARHDLQRLAAESGFLDVGLGARERRAVRLGVLMRLWRNSFRYMSDAKIARVLHATRQYPESTDRGVALVRMAAADAVAAARTLFEAGLAPAGQEQS